jgi:hypothetical protein
VGLRNSAYLTFIGRRRIPGSNINAVERLSALRIIGGGRSDQVVDHSRADVSKALMLTCGGYIYFSRLFRAFLALRLLRGGSEGCRRRCSSEGRGRRLLDIGGRW